MRNRDTKRDVHTRTHYEFYDDAQRTEDAHSTRLQLDEFDVRELRRVSYPFARVLRRSLSFSLPRRTVANYSLHIDILFTFLSPPFSLFFLLVSQASSLSSALSLTRLCRSCSRSC